ncbi:hypothetical protein [Escherichia coli]|uniref:hypothetical protein n=1 Tax=Escherichia coli TaxID=562 RepID=UPI00298D0C8E|nr:hypothetical protein [Escherichia coli]
MVLVSSVAAVRFIIVCGAVAIVKELPGVSKSIRRWPLIISIRSLAILTDFEPAPVFPVWQNGTVANSRW